MVNVAEAKIKLKQRGFSIAGYARANSFNLNTFKMYLRGQWSSNGPVATAYKDALVRDGLATDA